LGPAGRAPGGARGADRLRVCLATRHEPGTTGTSRYVDRLGADLQRLGAEAPAGRGESVLPVYVTTRPGGRVARALAVGRRAGMDLNTFLAQYPLAVRWPEADVYHLTVQTYAGLLFTAPPPGPVVVTVHDIIPYLTRHDRRLRAYGHPLHRAFDWLAMQGLRRAQRRGLLLADSAWTKRSLVQALGLDAGRIAVVPLGVDRERFHPAAVPDDVRRRYGLSEAEDYVLYVGSEDPRKNLTLLLRALARVCPAAPRVRLLKVGAAHHLDERQRLRRLAADLGIGHAVRFLDHVAEDDLPRLYNAATVCVLPSWYEGFGLPVLEAMACGTPVVCAAAAALPELAGGAACLVPPDDPEAFARELLDLLLDPTRRADLAERGLARAATFTWRRSAEATLDRYRTLTQAEAYV
jgi:glycosyltransferase involved in cell wall biosynthesis